MPLHPDDSPGLLMWRATLAWQRCVGAALAPFGLTHVQFVLLAVVWWSNEHGQVPTQSEVADRAGANVKMVSEVLRTLERRRLLVRHVDPLDGRARRMRVTRAGGQLAPQALGAVEAVDADFFGGVPRQDLMRVLQQLAAAS